MSNSGPLVPQNSGPPWIMHHLAPNEELDDTTRSHVSWETSTTGTWSEIFAEDSDPDLTTEFLSENSDDEKIANDSDDEYWKEDLAADIWLARNPGGTKLLYPRLFVVKQHKEEIISPPRDPRKPCRLLSLPSEIRNRIYDHYFDPLEAVHPNHQYPDFHNRDGKVLQKIHLRSEDVELKFWLSTALMQASRQLRSEAMFIFFSTRVFTIDWLLVLPRLVNFLGEEGCSMVRYLDVIDTMNSQGLEQESYRTFISSIRYFANIQHLRIILSSTQFSASYDKRLDKRWRAWFDVNERRSDDTLREHAIPKIKFEHLDTDWPEYQELKALKAGFFTLLVDTSATPRYLSFDRTYGAYPELSNAMQMNRLASSHLKEPDANLDVDVELPAWRDIDHTTTKSMLLYNWAWDMLQGSTTGPINDSRSKSIHLPIADKSTGSITRNCGFCYLKGCHCGYHSVPAKPFLPKHKSGDSIETENPSEIQAQIDDINKRYAKMSYVDMRSACQDISDWLRWEIPFEMQQVCAITGYMDLDDQPENQALEELEKAVKVGWSGMLMDKNKVPPWDVLYKEIHHFFPGVASTLRYLTC